MSKLSTEKMKQIARSKNLIYEKIANDMNVSKSNISKVFGGFRKNMQFKFLLELADYLGCTIDDFVDYDVNNENFYNTKELNIAARIYNNKKLYNLFSSCEQLSDEELDILNRFVRTFKK